MPIIYKNTITTKLWYNRSMGNKNHVWLEKILKGETVHGKNTSYISIRFNRVPAYAWIADFYTGQDNRYIYHHTFYLGAAVVDLHKGYSIISNQEYTYIEISNVPTNSVKEFLNTHIQPAIDLCNEKYKSYCDRNKIEAKKDRAFEKIQRKKLIKSKNFAL